jgi:hypothetical protein
MLEILQQSKDANIALKLSGIITEDDYQQVLPELENRIKGLLKFRLLIDWEDLEGWEQEANAAKFGMRFMHRWRCERFAIITDDPSRAEDIEDLRGILPKSAELQIFPPSERSEAWSWLTSE